ncbi:hypothetical protein [Stomatohabitans albus]|uniref:hypothetical protein n=1 Tax=Stomatohabitans albus TaxID=3110766 RepID=UPI00300C6061
MDIANPHAFAVQISGSLTFNSIFQSLIDAGTFDPEFASDIYARYSRLFDIADYRYSRDGIQLHDCNYLFNPEPGTRSIRGSAACLDHSFSKNEDSFIYLDRVISCTSKMMEVAGVWDIEQIAILVPSSRKCQDVNYLSERIMACCLRETNPSVRRIVRARLITHSIGEISIKSVISKLLLPYLEDEDIYIGISDVDIKDRKLGGCDEILVENSSFSHTCESVIRNYINSVSLERYNEYFALFSLLDVDDIHLGLVAEMMRSSFRQYSSAGFLLILDVLPNSSFELRD